MRCGKFIVLCIAMTLTSGVAIAQEMRGYPPFQLDRGEQLFLSNCAQCHGPDGDSIPGINLGSGQFRNATTDQDLINIIRKGIPGTPMPPSNLPEPQAG